MDIIVNGTRGATFLSHDEMRRASETGQVVPLSRIITDFVHHEGRWWVSYVDGWVAVDDEDVIERLDTARRLVAVGPDLGDLVGRDAA